MHLASCQHPYEPCVDCSEAKSAFLCLLTRSFDIVEDPAHLGGAEICIDDESGLVAYEVCPALLLEPVAIAGGPSVLPYNGVIYGLSCLGIPYYGGLALVGDAYAGDVLTVDAYRGYGFRYHRGLG